MIVIVPIIQTLIFGYAINYDVKHLKTVVLDEAASYESRELVAKLTASEYFDVVGYGRLARRAAARDRLGARLGRPRHRPRTSARTSTAARRRRRSWSSTPPTRRRRARRCRSRRASRNGLSIRAPRAAGRLEGDADPADRSPRAPLVQPGPLTATFIIPGLIAVILTFTLIQFTATAIVRERERGTLEQLQVTPVTRTELILGQDPPVHSDRLPPVHDGSPPDALPVRHRDPGLARGALRRRPALHRRRARPRDAHLDGGEDADAGDADVDVLPAAVRLPVGLRLPDRRDARRSSSTSRC